MIQQERRDFDKEAVQWDENPGRVKLAHAIADAIIREVAPQPTMDALDFGCGTGLVTMQLQPLVRTITGADSSQGMLDILTKKAVSKAAANVRATIVEFDKTGGIDGRFDLIVSSMTLHHVPDTAAILRQWHGLLQPGGLLAFADLDAEDGTFHTDNTGVFHMGFDRDHLKTLLTQAGFSEIRDSTAATIPRPVDGGTKTFPIFLIVARRA